MGERRVMELLLQFIMGGESIVGQSEAQHYSCGRKGGGECRVGSTTSLCVLPAPTLGPPAAAPRQGAPLRMETRRLPMTQAPVPPNSQTEGKQSLCHRSLACDHRIFPAVLASGFWTQPRFGLAASSPWHLDGPKH